MHKRIVPEGRENSQPVSGRSTTNLSSRHRNRYSGMSGKQHSLNLLRTESGGYYGKARFSWVDLSTEVDSGPNTTFTFDVLFDPDNRRARSAAHKDLARQTDHFEDRSKRVSNSHTGIASFKLGEQPGVKFLSRKGREDLR